MALNKLFILKIRFNAVPNKIDGNDNVVRTARKQAKYTIMATEDKPMNGVLGLLVDLLSLSVVSGIVIDYMHCVSQGETIHIVK